MINLDGNENSPDFSKNMRESLRDDVITAGGSA